MWSIRSLHFFAKKACSVVTEEQKRKHKHSWKKTQTFCSCRVTTILVKQPYQMQVWSFIENESNTISEEHLYIYYKFWNWYFFYFFKQYFSINWKGFCSIGIVYMSLEHHRNGIHRYTDKDASLLALKKTKQKTKRRKDLFTYLIYFCWLLPFFHLFFVFFSKGSFEIFSITVYRIFPQGNEFCLLKCTKRT